MSYPPSFATYVKPGRTRNTSCSVSPMVAPQPLAAPTTHTLTVGSPRTFTSCGTPLPPPGPSPPPVSPFIGSLEAAKTSLDNVASFRNTKASAMTIDEEMKDVCHHYSMLDKEEKKDFLTYLATAYSIDNSALEKLTLESPDFQQPLAVSRWAERVRATLEPPHAWVLTQVSKLAGGVKFLVDLRHDLLSMQSSITDEAVAGAVRRLDATMKEMLGLWFTVGLLELSRVTWDSSCSMLQKISEYEAVHPVRNWTDLKRRVGPYRRCFVFTHSCMPSEPLVVLHTFLTQRISGDMQDIVAHPRFGHHGGPDKQRRGSIVRSSEGGASSGPEEEDSSLMSAAVFYSITSTQSGLRGIELGNYLIKRVVQELMAELPGVTQFSSLSPIPGYAAWLQSLLVKALRGEVELFTPEEFASISIALYDKSLQQTSSDSSAFKPISPEHSSDEDCEEGDPKSVADRRTYVYNRIRQMIGTNSLLSDPVLQDLFKAPLMRLCAFYLYSEKRRGYALNSVAHFHLKNGATLWRLNYCADMSPRGLTNSCGLMVNYRYFLEEAETNSRSYQEDQLIPAGPGIVEWSEQAQTMLQPRGLKAVKSMPVIKLSEV